MLTVHISHDELVKIPILNILFSCVDMVCTAAGIQITSLYDFKTLPMSSRTRATCFPTLSAINESKGGFLNAARKKWDFSNQILEWTLNAW